MRRNPILSETDAFRVTVALLGLVILSLLVGWLAAPLVGVVLFVVLGLAVLAAYMRVPEDDRRLPLRRAAQATHPHGATAGTRHVIVVANEPLDGEELEACIRGRDGEAVEIDVLAPLLVSRTHLLYTDIDAERREAHMRLARSLDWARQHGFAAKGAIGDPNPATALEDELRDFGADEIIVVTSRARPDGRHEQTELDRLRAELDVNVVHLAVG